MIDSKEKYKAYLEADRIALGKTRKRPQLVYDEIWVFTRLMRKIEYIKNCNKRGLYWAIVYRICSLRYHQLSMMLGFEIWPNNCGPGLCLPHKGTIVIHPKARIGKNAIIHACVNIGTKEGEDAEVPLIGNDVYIGPGAKIFGPITIADRIIIGANAVVNKSFTEKGITIAGLPARRISDKGRYHKEPAKIY